ncbi:APC family permease [Actinomyces minihominis]|uniref:APC family permease n=1 Tax=Actinomyces minihominis TaxID=2002838 RepID=UPI001A934A4A|nr:APC family permease [Actinomyces minihominis]
MSQETKARPASGTSATGARKAPERRLGVFPIVIMIIGASAPLLVVVGGATTAYSVTANSALPAAYVLLALILAIFAVGYTAMSRFITNAGAFYAYAARGLGKPFGVGVSFVAIVAYNFMQIGIYGMFGFQVSELVNSWFGISIPWWLPILVGIVIVAYLGINSVDVSAKVLGIIVLFEFVLVIIFDVIAFANPAEGFTARPIEPAALFSPGIGAVLAFGIAAFMGFESAAIYSEEAKDPRRTVTRATFIAVIITGTFYAISSWALAIAVGPDRIEGGIPVEEAGPPLLFDFVASHMGVIVVDIISVLFITSLFAALVAFHNVVARYLYSLGREQVLPSVLAKVGEKSNAPWAGSLSQTLIATVVILGFAVAGNGSELGNLYPVVTLFSWLTNTGALGLVMLMALTSLSLIGFFMKTKTDVGLFPRFIAPAIAFVGLAAVFFLIVVNFNVLLEQEKPDLLTFLLPALVVAPGLFGTLWAQWLKRNRPSIYERIGYGAEDVEYVKPSGIVTE